jgi:N-acetylmuramoyl-L-alanine amidase
MIFGKPDCLCGPFSSLGFVCALLLTVAAGCTRPDVDPAPAQAPVILTLTPTVAAQGTLVVMTGRDFGETDASSLLTLDAALVSASDIFEWTSTRIAFWIPSDGLTGDVRLTTGRGSSNASFLTVTGPSPTPASRCFAPFDGSLTGHRVVVSPGHGYYFPSGTWTTQRGDTFGLIEDVHTNEIAMDCLIPMLERAGARVHSCRERSRQTAEVVVDNGDGAYNETGTWQTSAGLGYGGGDYRYAITSATGGAEAVWTPDIPHDGYYPVWVWYVAAANRTTKANYQIVHSGGETEVVLNQEILGSQWAYLGTFHFEAGTAGRLHLRNLSDEAGELVIADAVRFGAGMGSIEENGTTSGQPRWLECARYYTEFVGAPVSVWGAGDVSCRGLYADWMASRWVPGTPAAYVSIHTNAAVTPNTGTGTSSFIHDTSPSPGSLALQNAIHGQIITDIRAAWDAGWVDRGKKTANFGELRNTDAMPAVLLELAFHDTETPDNAFLHTDRFRHDMSRAIYKGLARHFHASPVIAPLPPHRLAVRNVGFGRVKVSWTPRSDPLEPSATASDYVVYSSPNGHGFDNGRVVTGTEMVLDRLSPGEVVYFRVAARNAGGESLPTEVLAARVTAEDRPRLLLVNGFDRVDRHVRAYKGENTLNYVIPHARAVTAAAGPVYGFDSASNEAVAQGIVPLAGYRVVDWILGEESTVDETFSADEQSCLRTYLSGGGSLFVSGSEIAWDLDFKGSPSDAAFLHEVLHASYWADDASGANTVLPVVGSLFEGLSEVSFDDGSHGVYPVDFPDVIMPMAGAEPCLRYGTSPVWMAGVQYRGAGSVIYLGFPFASIWQEDQRRIMMERILGFLDGP